ncbi:lysosomal-trafficking regulator-like isoform X3 [Argiope bruennichi]|uniref:lysosomal-trafficking regulator-like isoform X3 n=1 Tax=Argiope bruennichi TaxID=94029 RepID=UPI0024947DF8|nr:lysosomal-trafficking regulator-like isoform X3 [Argiope bruennichi]
MIQFGNQVIFKEFIMSSSDVNDLHKIWLSFLNTTKTDDGEIWLDTFLVKYLSLLCGPNVNINGSFSFQWKSSGNILAHQLLSDMYQICEKVKAKSFQNADHINVSEPFKQYLLEGRGWKILWTLENIGIQNLLCLKDLIKLLILHVPVLLSLPVCVSSIPSSLQRKPKSLPLSSCFVLPKRNKNVPCNIDLRWPENYNPKRKRNLFGKKRIRRKRLKDLEMNSSSSSGDDQVLFEPCAIPASQLRTLQKVHRINPTSVPKSLSEGDESDQEISSADPLLPVELQDFRCYSISVMDYMHFILNLFQESAQLDLRNSEYRSCSAPLILEFSLNALKDIHGGRYAFQGWPKEDVQSIQGQLLKLVFLSATVTYSSLNYTGAPNENEVISTLLTISDEIISFRGRNTETVFISEIIKGCLMLIHNTIAIYSEDYAKIICIVRTFYESGSDICHYVISCLDKQCENKIENDIFTIISLIKSIIIFLKCEKISTIHSENNNASVKEYIHHHHDLFGPSANYIDSSKEPVCCIGSMCCILLKIFNLSISKDVLNEVIKQIKMCGICCCLNPGFIVKILFSRFNHLDLETQHLTLVLLEKYLFPQLGLTSNVQNLCDHCSTRLIESENLSWPLFERLNESYHQDKKEMLGRNLNVGSTFWTNFNLYGDLLNSSAVETLENVVKHLIQIFADGSNELKRQIFVRVILPQFLHLSTSVYPLSTVQKIKSKCFLTILQLVLTENTLSAIFVNFGGIPILYPFLQTAEFRQLSLKALKILILSENETNQDIDFSNSYSVMMYLPASITFCEYLLEHTQLFSENLGRLLPSAKQSETKDECDLNVESKIFDNCLNSEEKIHFICDLWKSYKEVISLLKTDYFYRMSEKTFETGYNLFIMLLENLNGILTIQEFSKKSDVMKNVLLLIQSLLTVCIITQKEVSTKVAVLETVKSNLKAQSPKCAEYQILLFDFILKCCFSSTPVFSSLPSFCKGNNSNEVFDGMTLSDKDATDVGSYSESYAGDTEGSNSSVFQTSTKYEVTHQSFIEHGEVVKMLLELLMHFQNDVDTDWVPSALYLMQTLIKLCQECEINKMVLCKEGIPTMLLESFSYSLASSEKKIYDYQKATLDLFVLLAQHSIQPADLRKIMHFFKSQYAPITLLLKCLNFLVDSFVIQPVWSIRFPCLRKLGPNTRRLKKRLKTVYNIYNQYASLNGTCAWTCSALYFPLTEDTRWHSFNKGFSFTLWMKLDCLDHLCPFLLSESNKSYILYKRQISGDDKDLFESDSHMLHVVSVGSNKFLFELWFDKSEKDLIVRMINCANGEVTCLSKGVYKSVLQTNNWHHIAVNYSEDNNKSTIKSRVQIVLDGTKENVFNFTFKRSGNNLLNNCFIFLGHSEPEDSMSSAYSIGSFMFFKGDVLTRDIIFYLSSLGPNITNITDCAIEKRDSFIPKCSVLKNVATLVSSDVYMGIKVPCLEILQNSLLCSYAAETEDSYLVYPSLSRGFFPFSYSFPTSGNAKISGSQDPLYQKLPLELQVLSIGHVSCLELHDFQYAFQHAGGITVVLFLFAYVLEHGDHDKDLPEALNLILKLVNKNTIFAEDLIRIKGYELLTQMIISKKCTISNDLFQVLLQNCVTSFAQNKDIRNVNFLKFEKPTVISNTAIFNLMLKSIAFAKNSSMDILLSLFTSLDYLLDPKLANVPLNVEQMNYVHTVKNLLWLLKQNYIMAEEFFPETVAIKIPKLMQKLLTYKFDDAIFRNICHFTLLLHKSSSTYVCHSRSAFSFLTIADKLGAAKKDGLKNRTSTIWYADEGENYVFLQKEINLSRLFRRSSSVPNNKSSSFISEENSKLSRMKSAECLGNNNFLSSSRHSRQVSNEESNVTTDMKEDSPKNYVNVSRTSETSEICIGLLQLIHDFINKEASTEALQLIQPEIFIVLSYTTDSKVCVAALKVLSSYLKEANENVRNTFINIKGFHLLSNQLHQHPFDSSVLDACFLFLFNIPLMAVDVTNIYNSREVTTFHTMSWLPLLAILHNANSDPQICQKIILVLTKFVQLGPAIFVDLLDNGLCMSICHLIIQISQSISSKTDKRDIAALEMNSCMKSINNLLKVMTTELCSSKRSKDFSEFCEILHCFAGLERKCIDDYGPTSHSVQTLRECQCMMFQVIEELAVLWDSHTLKSNSTYLNGTFSTISVPVDDIGVENEELYPAEKNNAQFGKSIREIPMTEIISRFEYMLTEVMHFIVFKDPGIKISVKERDFIKAIFIFCVKGLGISMSKNISTLKSEYSTLMCCLKDALKKVLSSLLMSVFSPNQDPLIKEYVVEILASHPFKQKILHLVVFSITRIEYFLIFLDDLLINSPTKLKKNAIIMCSIVKDLLKDSSYLSILANAPDVQKLKCDWIHLWNEDRCKWISEVNKYNEKMLHKFESLAKEVSTEALSVTQKVFEIQNNERKSFMEELKAKYYEETSGRRTWFKLVEQMTHEKAVWHIPEFYPRSWELDPTEGPLRIRRRLKRCYLRVDSRFLRPDYMDRLVVNKDKNQPFLNLLLHDNEFPDSAAVLHRLHSHEQIEYTSTCKIVTAFEEAQVEILIGAYCIHLIGEESSAKNIHLPISESLPFDCIKEIVPRRYELQNNAFEIFLTNGLTYLIAFDSERQFQYIWKQLEKHGLPCQHGIEVAYLTQLWREKAITNFEYLTQLNKLAGRSFNDLMQYPVFPFILADYASPYLNLLDPAVYRNFEKPVAVQHKSREKFYQDTYELLKEQSCGPFSTSELPISGPYHYGSHYSNSGTVLYFLIRLLPYTYSFIKYQDNNFDIPDRAFHCVDTSWQLVTKDSTSDVKELIPEFFFLPEFLSNQNGFDFGVRQSGIRVNDVLLPPWCKQNPRLFILIHRQALESETVTKNLHNWIDLVFGYKQTGEAAIKAINVFHPATYFGFDINQFQDPISKQALKAMVKTLGQMPKQLFFNPHPMVSLSLASIDLTEDHDDILEVVDTVRGLHWGDFVGSPSTGVPSLVWCRKQAVVLGSFSPLLANYMFGLGENICLLLNQKKNSDVSSATYIMSAALVSWGHKDGIIRIKLCRDQPAIPLLRESNVDPVCLCASVPDCEKLFIAHLSGKIFVYSLYIGPSGQTVTQEQPVLQLNAHTDAVTSLYICKAFSIFVSTSKDGSVVIWDLNRLCYVRSLTGHEGPVELITVSDTLGDIASSSNICDESFLRVHTINGETVGCVKMPDIITALCYSTAPEGISVNLIATGFRSGIIRLWSSWDLKPVREIAWDRFLLPIKCIVFSADNQHLFASNENGTVAVWEKPSKGLTSVPRLLVFT